MNDYMLIYQGGDPDWITNSTEAEQAATMEKWGAWMGNLQQNEQLVSGGSPLVYGGKRLAGDGVVTDIAAAEFKELVSGYSIVRAASIEEAIKIAEACPIFDYPDTTTEVREVVVFE